MRIGSVTMRIKRGIRLKGWKMLWETGTMDPVIFSMKFWACFEVAMTSGMEPESPICQTTKPL